ncbi:hypothetical protein SU48_13160 [Deinococcus puniceus]|uniref:Uncharacterized protein n=1 Tax=Deinococcus puniceus TaxID=1182568 RepID=A0A172TDC3_9DEIO|nr:hypothetical protein SU48_13160 [Deinococcus puniceus]
MGGPRGWPKAFAPVAGPLLLAVLGTAGAQDLGAYNAVARSLDAAYEARNTSAAAALTQLDRASEAMKQLDPTLRNRQIAGGISDALTGARAALARTPAEVQAQILLARGLMRRALQDQTLTLLAGASANGDAQLRVLAREFGLSAAGAQALTADARAGRLERVAWRLQRSAAQNVSAALAAARPVRSGAAYLNLARATGWFTVVQNAQGVGTLTVTQFTDALGQLTAGDTAALGQSLTALRSGTASLNRSLVTAASTVSTPPPSTPLPPPATPAADPDPVDPAPTPAAQGSQGTQTGQNGAALGGAAQSGTAQGMDGVYGALGRALNAASHADGPTVRTALSAANSALARTPEAVRSDSGYSDLVQDLTAAQDRQALRPTDIQALIGEVGNLERRVAGEPVSALNAASAGVARSFGGWLRVGIFALLALLAFVPLYLLNLAFGGRNTYWRAIAGGLVLLLLPLLLEGLMGLLGAIGDAAGVGFLRSATNFTLTQGAYGLPLWALTSALAIGLTAFGFRGLCEQFGLIGKHTVAENATHQSLDWDEEV